MSHAAAATSVQPAVHRTDLRKIGPVALLVLAMHVVLLAIPRQPAAPSGTPGSARAPVQVRLLEAVSPKVQAPAITGAAAQVLPLEAPEATAATSQTQPVADVPDAWRPNAAPALAPTEPWLGLALPGVATDDDLYFPRAQLTAPPVAVDAVAIDYPRFHGDAGRYVAELALFIDETGRVVRVRVDSSSLPSALEDAARRAFTQARFRPGEAAEHGVVKSRIRIEVTFDGGSTPTSGG